ncbi:hypothetical protein, conserved [Eimeria praecox]|uniref:SET domain-containing protein n=1 Tax=Eimeria praecox TaxID=51316 RepID=U6G3D0_9EIME|nr:hypothetical protein, conserved [Eimeria praecox]
MSSDFEWAADYAALCSSYPFNVNWGPHGKELRASQPISAGQTLLVEAPLLAWPVKASAGFEAFSFCENCLRIRPFHPHPTQHKHKQRHASLHPTLPATAAAAGGRHPTESVSDEAAATAATAAAAAAASEGEEEETGICVREAEGGEGLWFCSPRCYHQAWGAPKAAEAEGTPPSAAAAAAAAAAGVRSKRDLDGSLVSPSTCSDSSNSSNSSSKWKEQREFGWMELLSLDSLLHLRQYDKQQQTAAASASNINGGEGVSIGSQMNVGVAADNTGLNTKTDEINIVKIQARGEETNTENPIGVEALGRAVARVAATTITLRNTFNLDLETAYAEACRPFLRLSAASAAEVLSAFDLKGAQQQLQQQLAASLSVALGPEATEALLGESALAFFYGSLMRNAQALLLWGATAAGSLMLLRGAGVYVLQACCNHSCIPNCNVQNEQDAFITLKAERDIQVGEEVTITYVPLDLPATQRQHLLNNYQFTCSCSRCVQELQQQQEHQQQQQIQ